MVKLGVFLNTMANLKRLVERIYENTRKHYFVTSFFNFLATFDFGLYLRFLFFLLIMTFNSFLNFSRNIEVFRGQGTLKKIVWNSKVKFSAKF